MANYFTGIFVGGLLGAGTFFITESEAGAACIGASGIFFYWLLSDILDAIEALKSE